MRRDSLFGEPVLWSGRPKEVSTPTLYRVAALVCAAASAISTAAEVAMATALGVRPGGLLAFAAWMATLAVAFAFGPRWWRSELEFLVTDRHVIMRRGRFRRSIEIKSISYARILLESASSPASATWSWSAPCPPARSAGGSPSSCTGWSRPTASGPSCAAYPSTAPAGDGHRLLAQRLDEGERVLWAAHPVLSWRNWVPMDGRSVASIAIALGLGWAAKLVSAHGVHALRLLAAGGAAPGTPPFVAFVVCLSLVIVLLTSSCLGVLYTVVIRPARLAARTRYLITDCRVLIQRGDDELHLDRSRIVDVIDAPAEGGLHDIFLVLDGPRARAVAASGAFGEARGQGLQPVLHRVTDVDAVQRILQESREQAVPRAA